LTKKCAKSQAKLKLGPDTAVPRTLISPRFAPLANACLLFLQIKKKDFKVKKIADFAFGYIYINVGYRATQSSKSAGLFGHFLASQKVAYQNGKI
jgi:hypothetical protein